jgi:hypothetical protein
MDGAKFEEVGRPMVQDQYGSTSVAVTLVALDEAFRAAVAGLGGVSDGAEVETAFLTRVLEDYRRDELPEIAVSDFGTVLAAFWMYVASAAKGVPSARI